MSEEKKQVTQEDLNKVVTEEMQTFLRENQVEIVKRALVRLKQICEEDKKKD